MRNMIGILGAVASVFLLTAFPARAAEYVTARLIGPETHDKAASGFDAGLDLDLAEGWHVYWRMPGEGGLPPRFDWRAADNVKGVTVSWPLPRRFEEFGLQSFGYEGTVLFPLHVEKTAADGPVDLKLNLAVMVCDDICIPQDLVVERAVPAGAEEEMTGAARAVLQEARDSLPQPDDRPDLKIENMVIGPDALVATVFAQRGFDHADLYVEAGEEIYLVAPPEITIDERKPRRARLRIPAPEGVDNLSRMLDGQPVTLTLTDGKAAIERVFKF